MKEERNEHLPFMINQRIYEHTVQGKIRLSPLPAVLLITGMSKTRGISRRA